MILAPAIAFAQSEAENAETVFEARVIEISEEKNINQEDGSVKIQQNLRLVGLTGDFKDREFDYRGIGEVEVVGDGSYQVGDRVLVSHSQNADGNEAFFVLEKMRQKDIYVLVAFFVVVVLVIGKIKGLRALIGLILSFLIIIKFIVPQILAGANPVAVAVAGSFFILLFIIYITEGVNRKSHLAVLSIVFCLAAVFILSDYFIDLLKLTGTVEEEVAFLISAGKGGIDFRGLLLAAFLIGALGILDDVVISQIEAVGQIRTAAADLPNKKIFKMAMEIGGSHLGAIINTLFLARSRKELNRA